MKLSELENTWDLGLITEPDVDVASVMPRDQKRSVPRDYVARVTGNIVAEYRSTPDGGLAKFLDFMQDNEIQPPMLSPVQHMSHEEVFHLVLNGAKHERHDSEYGMAERAALKLFPKIFPKTFQISGWIRGTHVRHAGDVFELTGNRCPKCFVNPEAYGHGGGVRCLDVRNCGYWFCL